METRNANGMNSMVQSMMYSKARLATCYCGTVQCSAVVIMYELCVASLGSTGVIPKWDLMKYLLI